MVYGVRKSVSFRDSNDLSKNKNTLQNFIQQNILMFYIGSLLNTSATLFVFLCSSSKRMLELGRGWMEVRNIGMVVRTNTMAL